MTPDKQLEVRTALVDARQWADITNRQVDRLNEWLWDAIALLDSGEQLGVPFRFQLDGDRHFLVLAAHHLKTALGAARPASERLRLSPGVERAVESLRNIFEHWDEQRPAFQSTAPQYIKSGKSFREQWPEADPWHFEWHDGEGMTIGPLSVQQLVNDLFEVTEELRRLGVIPTGTISTPH